MTSLGVIYFNDNKAPDLLLKAWQKIKGQFLDWRLYMLGNGEVERFQKMADDMGLCDSVTFTDYITGEEKDKYFRKASILTRMKKGSRWSCLKPGFTTSVLSVLLLVGYLTLLKKGGMS